MNLFLLQAEPAIKPSLDVLQLLMKGGVVMIPLALLSVASIVLILERMMYFGKNLKAEEKTFRTYLEQLLAGRTDDALQLCQAQKNSWGRIFMYGAVGSGASAEETDKRLEEAANVEIARMESGLNYLSIIATVAPLLGFVGTIAGVIQIFFDISVSSDISISVISEGLYKKMITSAVGLVIGIIASSAHSLFQNSIDAFVAKIQAQSLNLRIARSGNR